MLPAHASLVRRRAALSCLAVALGCGSDQGEPPGISGDQFTLEVALAGHASRALILIVDDAEESRPIREAIAAALTPANVLGSCVATQDPAVWDPVDLSVAIVRPSRADEPYVTAIDDPDLRWRADDSLDLTIHDRFRQALERWLVPSESPTASAPRLLEAFANVEQLLARTRAPGSSAEQKLIDSLPQPANGAIILASAREDGSPLSPESYAVPLDGAQRGLSVVAPADQPEPTALCTVDRPSTARFAGWLEAQPAGFDYQPWPCNGFQAIPQAFAAECEPRCLTRGPMRLENGQAACLLSVAIDPEQLCPNERGWFDPANSRGDRAPRVVNVGGERRRICEIVQLGDAALEQCRMTWALEPVQPGWCWTELSAWTTGCQAGRTALALRMLGAASLGPPGVAELTCVGESFAPE